MPLIVGNPVSYSERVFDERSRLHREQQKKQAQIPLGHTSVEEAHLEPLPQPAISDFKTTPNKGLADMASTMGCGLGLAHVTFAQGSRPPFEHLSNLGNGTLSIVEEVKSTKTGGIFVRKSIGISQGRADWLLPMIKQEVDVLKRLSHGHIITIQGTYEVRRTFCIIMSPVGDGDLGGFMEDVAEHGFPKDQRVMLWEWMPCLVSALLYLHEQGVRHRDIKPANIIYKGSSVFMTDFGSCRQFDMDATSSTNTASFGNTKLYSAPEVLVQDSKRGRPADIFSLGCVLLEMYTVCRQRSVVDFFRFRERFASGNPTFGVASQETLLEWTSSISSNDIPELNDEAPLLRRMLLEDPSERPEAKEVSLSLKAQACKHIGGDLYRTVDWSATLGEGAGGEQRQVY